MKNKKDSFTCIFQGLQYLTDFTFSVENKPNIERTKSNYHRKNIYERHFEKYIQKENQKP